MTKHHTSALKENMTHEQRSKLGMLPTYHVNCIEHCGVARPGKTRRDKRKRGEL